MTRNFAILVYLLFILPVVDTTKRYHPRSPGIFKNGYCFSGRMTVHVFDKGDISMKELSVGDLILTGSGHYEPVYAFGRYDKDAFAAYLQIETTAGAEHALEISGEHMLFLHGNENPVRADSLVVGDVLLQSSGDGKLSGGRATVIKITHVTRTGRFSPLTFDGTLVVNGIVTSSYIYMEGMEDVDLLKDRGGSFFHFAISPFRFLCMAFHSNAFCETYTDEGIPHGLDILMSLVRWIAGRSFPLKQLGMLLYAIFAAFFSAIEWMVHVSPTIDEVVVVTAAFLSYNIHFAPIRIKNDNRRRNH